MNRRLSLMRSINAIRSINMLTTCAALLAIATSATPAHATVTAWWVDGNACKAAPTTTAGTAPTLARFTPDGAKIVVSLCMTSTTERICGHSVRLDTEDSDGTERFHVTERTLGPNYSDPTIEKFPKSIVIQHPSTREDFGGTSDKPVPPAANQLLVTIGLAAKGSAKKDGYVLRLSANSVVSVSGDGTCERTRDVPITGTFRVEKSK